jgi:RNA polymerase-binding transcription factor DksA
MKSVETRREELERRLGELRARIARIEGELEQPVSDSFAEQAVEREEEEVLEDLGAAGVQEIRMIEAALDRIENGSYGTCVRCGDPIGEERLDVLPATPLCRDCAASRGAGRS